MMESSVVGDLINFRGLVYSPMNENGVVFLFGKVVEDLNMYIEEIKPGFPDCVGRRFTGRGWERVSIEFEFKSSNFKQHGHDPRGCDLVVCWEHDWSNCPVEVVELKEVIKSLPNHPIQRPDAATETEISIEERLGTYPEKVRRLFAELDARMLQISDEIWHKPTTAGATYYSPERVFAYVDFQKSGLKLTVFTRGQKLEGLRQFDYEMSGAKWGQARLTDEAQLQQLAPTLKASHDLIKDAIKENETTGWYARLEEEPLS
jgi:predicted DNA-binding protein (MmcQ/YjbR family)